MARRFKAIILLCVMVVSHAQVVIPGAIMRTIATGGGGPAAFSYDFTGSNNDPWNTTIFTEVDGNVNIQGNTGNFVEGGFDSVLAVTTDSCTTVSQYHKFILSTVPALSFLHAAFRYTDASSPFYTVEIDVNNGNASWYRYASLSDWQSGTSTTIGTAVLSGGALSVSDLIAITLDGTGTSTVIRIWVDPDGAANTPTSPSNWGGDTTPTASITDDPASPVNTGLKLGLGIAQNTANSQRIDNWFGGDTPP